MYRPNEVIHFSAHRFVLIRVSIYRCEGISPCHICREGNSLIPKMVPIYINGMTTLLTCHECLKPLLRPAHHGRQLPRWPRCPTTERLGLRKSPGKKQVIRKSHNSPMTIRYVLQIVTSQPEYVCNIISYPTSM